MNGLQLDNVAPEHRQALLDEIDRLITEAEQAGDDDAVDVLRGTRDRLTGEATA